MNTMIRISPPNPKHPAGITAGPGIATGNLKLDFSGEYSWWSVKDIRYFGGSNRIFDYTGKFVGFGVSGAGSDTVSDGHGARGCLKSCYSRDRRKVTIIPAKA